MLTSSAVLTIGCHPEDQGWRPLWRTEWARHHHGVTWVQGVEAGGRQIIGRTRGETLRAELLSPATEAAEVVLVGPAETVRWILHPGERLPIEVELARGSHRLEAPAGTILGSPRVGRLLERPRTLVCIVVDTLRADHLSPELTPGIIDAFRRSGALELTSAAANAPWTLPSMASFFTARPVLDLSTPEGDLIGVPEGLTTWPEQLSNAGFSTAGIVANYSVHALNGFGNGFDTFLVPDGHGSPDHPDARWVVEQAEEWLAAHEGEDRCLYLHLMDPHAPYRSHQEPHAVAPSLDPLSHRERAATLAEATLLRRLYAGEVRHVDEMLAPFLDSLPETALVALTADHGEALGEHGSWGHGLDLYQEALAVPLLIRGPGVKPGISAAPVQLMDLGPTLLDLLGVQPDPGMVGSSLLEGGSAPIVAATFGGGPLRWSWRSSATKITIRTTIQPGLGTEARSRMEEAVPLPPGAFVVDLETDPAEQRPLGLDGELSARAATTFATTAGRMVPGVQLWLWGHPRAATLQVEAPGEIEIVQAWSTSAMRVTRQGDLLTLDCTRAEPLCVLAFRVSPDLEMIRPLPGTPDWTSLRAGIAVDPGRLTADPGSIGRAQIWLNPERPRITGAYEETIDRLRALGYLQ